MERKKRLQREASESCDFRGHQMLSFDKLSPTCYGAQCKQCGMNVFVELKPMPNEIAIYGEAVALSCLANES